MDRAILKKERWSCLGRNEIRKTQVAGAQVDRNILALTPYDLRLEGSYPL